MTEELGSSEMAVLSRAIRHDIPEHCILHSNRLENLKPYTAVVIMKSLMITLIM
jgi:hypothetical protein